MSRWQAVLKKKDIMPVRITKLSPEKGWWKNQQSKSSPHSKKKKKYIIYIKAVNSVFQAVFALHVSSMFMNWPAQIWGIPTAHIGGKEGSEAHPPPLQVQSHTRRWEERFCSWRCHMRLSTLHHVNFTEQSQHINSYRKNTSQMFAKALVRRRTCSKKGYSTASSS